jgi:polyhydroxyalkanoate synthesis regulator phasin
MHTQVREERDKIQQMLEAEQAARADEVAELHAEVERLQDKAVEAEAQRVRANEERERIESVLENFHEQNMSESSFEVEKLRKVVAARELEVAALQDKERELLATVAELQKAPVSSDLETQLAGG